MDAFVSYSRHHHSGSVFIVEKARDDRQLNLIIFGEIQIEDSDGREVVREIHPRSVGWTEDSGSDRVLKYLHHERLRIFFYFSRVPPAEGL